MPHPWNDLHDATYRGKTFEFFEVTDEGGHALTLHEFADRPGAAVEDSGRRALRISIVAVFHGDGYLEKLLAFKHALEEQGSAELVHPFHGSIHVAVDSFSLQHRAEEDFSTVPVTFVEDSTEDVSFWGLTVTRPGSPISPAAAEARLTQAMSTVETQRQALLGTPSSSTAAVARFRDWISSARQTVETTEAEIETRLRAAHEAIAGELREVATGPAEVAPLLDALHGLAAQATDLASVALARFPAIQEMTLTGEVSVHELASRLYGDAARVDDLLRLNDLPEPLFIRRGTVLRVHAR
jgi:prophage DNA circulation protein